MSKNISKSKLKKKEFIEKQNAWKNKKPRNQNLRTREQRTVQWGKFAGKRFIDVPTDYLEWFVKNAYKQMENRKQWAIEELNARKKEKVAREMDEREEDEEIYNFDGEFTLPQD